MIREFIRLAEFEKQCKVIGLTEDDIIEIENALLVNPEVGDILQGTGGIRKFRYALPNKGKSGGTRVVYIDFTYFEKVYLLTIFAKSDIVNLTKSERNDLKEFVRILKLELGKKE